MLPIFVGTSLLLILTDSLYYGDLTIHKLWHLSMKYSDWKVYILQGQLFISNNHPLKQI